EEHERARTLGDGPPGGLNRERQRIDAADRAPGAEGRRQGTEVALDRYRRRAAGRDLAVQLLRRHRQDSLGRGGPIDRRARRRAAPDAITDRESDPDVAERGVARVPDLDRQL